jgi:FdhD protein
MADAAGITLLAIARADGFEVFTNPHRISNVDAISVPTLPRSLRCASSS